MFQVASLLK